MSPPGSPAPIATATAPCSSRELQQDAARFFALLDGDGDGELAMAEIARYENEIAPEVQVGLQMREHRASATGREAGGGGSSSMSEGVDGAGRFSFLNIPHPVMAADSDMNRGVSRDEFAQAAAERFALLDKDRDGRLPAPGCRRCRSRASAGQRGESAAAAPVRAEPLGYGSGLARAPAPRRARPRCR